MHGGGLPPGQRLRRPAARTGGGPPPGEPGAGSPSGGLRERNTASIWCCWRGICSTAPAPSGRRGNSWPPLWDRCGPGCSSPPATTTGTDPAVPGRRWTGRRMCTYFKENRLTAVEVPERNLVIHGAAFYRPGTAGEPAGGFHRPGRRQSVTSACSTGSWTAAEARYDPIRREEVGGQRPLLSGTGPRPQADGAPDTGADGLRLARLSGGPGV